MIDANKFANISQRSSKVNLFSFNLTQKQTHKIVVFIYFQFNIKL